MSQARVGDFFGVTGSSISWGIKRLKAMAEMDRKIRKLMEMSYVQV